MNSDIGLYFQREDYAPFGQRLLVTVIDATVIGTVTLALLFVLVKFPSRIVLNSIFATLGVFVFLYAVVLQRVGVRTLGYRLGKVKIVGVDGQTPGTSALTLRILFMPLGPFNWVADFLWLAGDNHRQTLRDKFAHTYVVKLNAEPAGKGKIVYRQYDIFGANLMMQEIEPPTNTGRVTST